MITRGNKSFGGWGATGTWPNALEMNQHVIEHGRMFNEIDDESARNVCVIGTAVRDELFGTPEETSGEIIPIGELININGQPFSIIGMFQHYESEQERKLREFEKLKPKQDETDYNANIKGAPAAASTRSKAKGKDGAADTSNVGNINNNTKVHKRVYKSPSGSKTLSKTGVAVKKD